MLQFCDCADLQTSILSPKTFAFVQGQSLRLFYQGPGVWDHNEWWQICRSKPKKELIMNKRNKNKMDFSKCITWSSAKIPPRQCKLLVSFWSIHAKAIFCKIKQLQWKM
jgi:hypothetical protein